jgi:hypothetical protein
MTFNVRDESIDKALLFSSPGDVIRIDGNCVTQGAWRFPGYVGLKSGVRIECGSDAVIRLVNPITTTDGKQRSDKDLPIMRCDGNTEIVGGTWDCNYQGNAGWFTQGFRFFGTFTMRDATIIGMSGSRNSGTLSKQVESFAISAEGNISGSVASRVTVKGCKVTNADDYVSGIYMGGTQPSTALCRVIQCNVDLGQFGQFAYASNSPTLFEACYGKAARWWYCDTADSRNAVLQSCRGEASYAAISSVAIAPCIREVWAHDCEFTAPRLVEWWDQNPKQDGMTGFVTLSSSTFNGDFHACVSAVKGSVSLLGCSIPLGSKVSVGPGSNPNIVRLA